MKEKPHKRKIQIEQQKLNVSRNELAGLKLSDPVLFSVVLIYRFDKHERKKSHIRGKFKYIIFIVEIKRIKK